MLQNRRTPELTLAPNAGKESREELHKFASLWATLLTGGLFVIALTMVAYGYNMAEKASTAADKANTATENATKQQEKLQAALDELKARDAKKPSATRPQVR